MMVYLFIGWIVVFTILTFTAQRAQKPAYMYLVEPKLGPLRRMTPRWPSGFL